VEASLEFAVRLVRPVRLPENRARILHNPVHEGPPALLIRGDAAGTVPGCEPGDPPELIQRILQGYPPRSTATR